MEGRDRERNIYVRKTMWESHISWLPPARVQTGHQTPNLGMCHDRESNLQSSWCAGQLFNQLSHHPIYYCWKKIFFLLIKWWWKSEFVGFLSTSLLGTHLSIIDKYDWQSGLRLAERPGKDVTWTNKMGFAHLQQRLASYSPWAKSDPPPAFANKVLLKHCHAHLHFEDRIELAAKEILRHPKPKVFTTCPVWKKPGDPNAEGRWSSQNTEQRDRNLTRGGQQWGSRTCILWQMVQ